MAVHYLPAEALGLIKRLAHRHPRQAFAEIAALYGVSVMLIRWRSRGDWASVLIMGAILTAIAIFVAACLLILRTHPGFQIVGFER